MRKSTGVLAPAALLTLLLSGCAYDYLQHTDRVGYSTGDAVKANLEAQTTNPSKHSMGNKGGLGQNGVVVPGGTGAPAATN